MIKDIDYEKLMSIPDIELAYIAGFFDGEGMVSVYKRKNKLSKGGFAYETVVTLSQKKREVLDWVRERFGGNIRMGNGAWLWEMHGNKQCPAFLRFMVKYSIVKRDQIEMALEFCKAYQDMDAAQKDNVVNMISLAKRTA